jgi:hypothetical protein
MTLIKTTRWYIFDLITPSTLLIIQKSVIYTEEIRHRVRSVMNDPNEKIIFISGVTETTGDVDCKYVSLGQIHFFLRLTIDEIKTNFPRNMATSPFKYNIKHYNENWCAWHFFMPDNNNPLILIDNTSLYPIIIDKN